MRNLHQLELEEALRKIADDEKMRETAALLALLALGERQVEEGKVRPAAEVIERLRQRRLHEP